MIIRLPRNFLFPLATFAFVAVVVAYVNLVFTPSTRWVFLALLLYYLLRKGRFMMGLDTYFGLMLASYCCWCIITAIWSEVPELSVAKAIAFSLVSVTFVSAGHWWVYDRGSSNAVNYLAPITALALFACVGGTSEFAGGRAGLAYYEGLTDNPNMFGSLLVMALPFLLWLAYRYRTSQTKWIFIALMVIAGIFLARSFSRSSMMSAAMVGVGFCLSLRLSRAAFILIIIGGALLVAVIAGSTILTTTYQTYVLKGVNEDVGGLLYTRQQVWDKSYENAKRGGWFGVGYGVTVGDMKFQGGLSAVGYGREKGNTQLAIIEETGVIGLAFYSILLLALFARLISAHLREKTPDVKVALGLVTGGLAGLTTMSFLEAWWVSPGSPESVYFWSLAGVGLCLAHSGIRATNSLSPKWVAQRAV
jgi:O-antigen ligase